MGGGKCAGVQDLFQDGCTGSYPLWLRDVGGDPSHFQDAGGFPTQDGPTYDWESASEYSQKQMLVPPPPGGVNDVGQTGGGGGIHAADAE